MPKTEKTLEGRIVAAGVAVGVALVEDETVAFPRYTISESQVEDEQERVRRAVEAIRRGIDYQLGQIGDQEEGDLHQLLRVAEMVLADDQMLEAINRRIAATRRNAEWVVAEEGERVVQRFQNLSDPYLRDRSEDMRDLGRGLLEALAAERTGSTCSLNVIDRPVVVSRSFFASTALYARRLGAVAFVTESQATASHAAIILKGLGIPVLGGVAGLLENTRPGDDVVVDALAGRVVLRPTAATRAKYEEVLEQEKADGARLDRQAEVGAPVRVQTRDGEVVHLLANIENPRQLTVVIANRLEGVGLFRTEFLALERGRVPGEEEQVAIYRKVLRAMRGRPVVIRTLDIGADKDAGLARCTGANPALGVRGVRRHLMREPEEFETQLRAILRASPEGRAKILIPMVARIEDLRQARAHLEKAKGALAAEGVPFSRDIPLGAMIEIPSAAISSREILEEADFISIGTNDLVQYFTAADRDNPDVLTYQDTRDPAFVWLLEYIAKSAREAGRMDDVSICGEMASDPEMIAVLVRLGYRTLSVSPAMAESVRRAVGESLARAPSAG